MPTSILLPRSGKGPGQKRRSEPVHKLYGFSSSSGVRVSTFDVLGDLAALGPPDRNSTIVSKTPPQAALNELPMFPWKLLIVNRRRHRPNSGIEFQGYY